MHYCKLIPDYINRLKKEWIDFHIKINRELVNTYNLSLNDLRAEAEDDRVNERYSSESIDEWFNKQVVYLNAWQAEQSENAANHKTAVDKLIAQLENKKLYTGTEYKLDTYEIEFTEESLPDNIRFGIEDMSWEGYYGERRFEVEFNFPATEVSDYGDWSDD